MRNLFKMSLLLVLVLAVGSPLVYGDPDKKIEIEGTWLVKVNFLPGVLDFKLQYLQTFNKDGRTTALLPTGGPEGSGNTGDTRVGCMGEWAKRLPVGDTMYDFTQNCLYSQEWVPSPDSPLFPFYLGELSGKATLDPSGDTWSAYFVYTNYDVDGAVLDSGDGVMDATRIVVKPLP